MLCYVHKMFSICLNKTRACKQQPVGHILPYLSYINDEHSHVMFMDAFALPW